VRPRRAGELLDAVLDLVAPARCAGCDAPRTQLCPDCRAFLHSAPGRRVPRQAGRRGLPALPEIHAVADYADPVRGMILHHKERGALRLARPLGEALATAVRTAVSARPGLAETPILLVPVPSAPSAVRARGHDPMRRLAREAARALRAAHIPARVLPALRPVRAVADQAGLGAAERQRNLSGALGSAPRWERALAAGRVVLVDDLVTTGATLAEAARALTAAGADVLAAATIAATTRRPPPRVVTPVRPEQPAAGPERAGPGPAARS